MEIIKDIVLDFYTAPQVVVKAKQGDNGRYVRVTLLENGQVYKIPDGSDITIGSGTVWNTCTVTNGTVLAPLSPDMLIPGNNYCQIEIVQGGKKITSASFVVAVEKSARNDNAIIGSDNYGVLDKAIKETEQKIADADKAIQDAVSATREACNAANNAEEVTGAAYNAATSANAAAEEARLSCANADTAAANADSKAVYANKAATAANNAAINAEQSKKEANIATEEANKAAELANSKASIASNAADAANQIADHLTAEESNVFTRIQTKADAVLESIPDDYEALNLELKALKNGKADAIMTTAEGTSVILNDSADASVAGLKVFGRSEQIRTTGAQLFNKDAITKKAFIDDANGVVTNADSDVNASDYITITGYDYITITTSMTSGRWGAFYDANKVFLKGINNYSVPVIVPAGAYYVRLTVRDAALDTFMLNSGSVAKPFEQYTGGSPSPSPEYPQEIVSMGDSGIIRQYISGKNLADSSNAVNMLGIKAPNATETGFILIPNTDNDRIINVPCLLKKGKTYVVSANFKHIGSEKQNVSVYLPYAQQYNIYLGVPFIPKESGTRIGFYTSVKNPNVKVEITNIQVEEGSTPTEFEPYKPIQQVSIATPDGLKGIKVDTTDYTYMDKNGQRWIADFVDFKRGKYVQRIEKLVFDGSADELWKIEEPYKRFYISLESKIKDSDANTNKIYAMCNMLELGKYASTVTDIKNIFTISGNVLLVKTNGQQSEEEYINMLKGQPMIFYAVLTNPVETDLTQEQLQAFKALHTNKTTTIMYNDANALTEIGYVADTKNYVDNKISEAIARQVGQLANTMALMPVGIQAAMIDTDTNYLLESEGM